MADGHRRGEFAFLSACKTQTGGVLLLDESITLAAALHYVGWQQVIATVWSVSDQAAAEIAEHLYPRLVSDGRLNPRRAAEALHHAVRQLRDTRPYPLSRWALFLHTGPQGSVVL
jgi:CHAT domain-containing protein